ncbi:TonB-dependent receptor [Schlegelella sp. S2-27]|uniref:TonB-dependent receptor n=1 Tax=Caldimonas mangrovi TaxID=2944811 RepID=A0ABT0YJ85_9BURK|nr:TonB-dependent receptor [Caldimonas mangrovi]MCM5678786.1 TonB-dependent receptor [Caldimonas mangrovi]
MFVSDKQQAVQRPGGTAKRAVGRALIAAAAAALPWGAASGRAVDLADLSLEQLRDIVVTSVSRRDEPLSRAAASVFVISSDDIRRSGATTLPEALRLAPTLDIARADANQYAISARGFNNVLANKMLVMIDGRTLYTPLFSGVFWEVQDVLLEDVERIEVITGPSTALWGTNAVGGLIHVITRRAQDTQGSAALVHGGTGERGAAVRHGGRWGDNGHYRLYFKQHDRRHTEKADGEDVRDASDGGQAGFRADWELAGDRLTLQGDLYRVSIEQAPGLRKASGGNLLGRWRRQIDARSHALARVYFDRTRREQPALFLGRESRFDETLDTVDVVVQYALHHGGRHELLLGAGYRRARDDVDNPAAFAFVLPDRTLQWSRVFAQDVVALSQDLHLTLSASVERNPYTGTEVLPSLRLAWRRTAEQVWWAGISRAVRAPSRIDREFYAPAEPPYLYAGGQDFRAEVSDVIEVGHRAQPYEALSYSVTAFHHRHRRLRSLTPTAGGAVFDNGIEGTTGGLQGWISWRPTRSWRLQAGGVVQDQRLHLRDGYADAGGLQALGNDPSHWWSLRSAVDVTPALAWDLALRRVGARPDPRVPAYTAVDTRLAWRARNHLELALVVHNLFDPGHVEWGAAGNRAEFGRAASLQLRWRL